MGGVLFLAFLDAFASRKSGYQIGTLPTERSEVGSQNDTPLPVPGGGALLCVPRSVNDAGVRTKEGTGHRKRWDGSYARSATLLKPNLDIIIVKWIMHIESSRAYLLSFCTKIG